MTSGAHNMCGVASVAPQTVPNQICDVFYCQNELCMKLPPTQFTFKSGLSNHLHCAVVNPFLQPMKVADGQ